MNFVEEGTKEMSVEWSSRLVERCLYMDQHLNATWWYSLLFFVNNIVVYTKTCIYAMVKQSAQGLPKKVALQITSKGSATDYLERYHFMLPQKVASTTTF